jgi:hypothetical protein
MKLDGGGTYSPATAIAGNATWLGDGLDHWAPLDATLKARAGIQCESCHGPGSQHNGNVAAITVPYGVGSCAVCHDAPGHHDKVELWSQSPHHNALAARGESAAAPAPDCARCHTAQGFAAMASQIVNNGTADLPAGFFIPAGTGQAQTCQACHDAHTTELRLHGDIAVTPNGYGFKGVGAAATCLGCHVARNMAPASGAVGTPHHGPQGDIMFGVNAYFVNAVPGANISKHAAVADVCVGCHVKLIPEGVETENDNHVFRTNDSICKHCHSESVNGEATKGAVQTAMAGLQTKLAGSILATFNAEIASGSGKVTIKQATDTSPQTITFDGAATAVAPAAEFHGSPAWSITATVGGVAQTQTAVTGSIWKDTDTTATGVKLMDPAGTFSKALWNYLLIESDKSEGIHNPTFVLKVIDATMAQTF